jgi:predicted nucleic acid-binding protein
MTIVVDASVVVAALIDSGDDGIWAEGFLSTGLVAPHLMSAEVANILRRSAARGEVSSDVASLAHADLIGINIELFAYEPFAARVWELRDNLTCYDAWYVALAETLSAPLATLDQRLTRAVGPRCTFLTPHHSA